MSSVLDKNSIDKIELEKEQKSLILFIYDNLEWSYKERQSHMKLLQDKINAYLDFIQSGQIYEHYDKQNFNKIIIRVNAQFSYSKSAIDFLNRIKIFLNDRGPEIVSDIVIELDWGHFFNEKNDENNEFNDGFIEEFELDADKIYPRLKRNMSKDLANIKLDGVPNDFVSFGYFDNKYAIVLLQDEGETLHVLSLKDIEDSGMYTEDSLNLLLNKSFENLFNNVEYRMQETIENGIYGLLAGGNFESESLCRKDIWSEISEIFNDDLFISAPAKDLVFFIPASNKDLINKFLEYTKKSYDSVCKDNISTIFTKDIFEFNRNEEKITISKEYNIE